MLKHFLDMHSEHSVVHLTSGALFVLMSLNELFVAPLTALLSISALHQTLARRSGRCHGAAIQKKIKAFLRRLNQLLMSDS